VENGGAFRPAEVLRETAHRPYPLSGGPWIMTQRWHDLLFAHWSLDPEDVRAVLPVCMRPYLETFEGKAWLGIVPFWMSHVRPRWMPPIPSASRFPELNVRTYVNVNGIGGVYFFSLDAESWLAVQAARYSFNLNYQYAHMEVRLDKSASVIYSSRRVAQGSRAELEVSYRPTGTAFEPQRGTLEDFLTGRYCLYTCKNETLFRANIHHFPWRLQAAEARFTSNSMALANGMKLPETEPLLHYSESQDVLVWFPEKAKA
jgi:uncharacterized protein YqjF (DUF2071 family)